MNLLALVLLLTSLPLLSITAVATPRSKLLVVLLESPGLPVCDLEMASKVIDGAVQQMAPAVRVTPTLMTIPHPFPELQAYETRQALAQALLRFAKRDIRLPRLRIHFLTPPLIGPNGEWYSYGFGPSSCQRKPVSVSSCIEYNDLGQNRVIASVFSMAHESLHGMGARHTLGGLSIMDPDPLPFSVEYDYLPVKKRTIREVRQCLKK